MIFNDSKIYGQFLELLYSEGLTPIEHETPCEPLEIYRGRNYVCSLDSSDGISYENESEDLNRVRSIINVLIDK